MAHQVGEQFGFLRQQAVILATAAHVVASEVDVGIAEAQRSRRLHRAPLYGLDAGIEVVKALGNTFSREAAPPLLEMLKDEDAVVRKAAQAGLDELANYLDAKARWEVRLK